MRGPDYVRLVDMGEILRVLEGGIPLTIEEIAAAAYTPVGEVRKIVDQLTLVNLVRPEGGKFVRHRS
jgi:hypothetical protein